MISTTTLRMTPKGMPVQPQATTLEEAHAARKDTVAIGVFRELYQEVSELSRFARYDESELDLNPKKNEVVYSTALQSISPQDWTAASAERTGQPSFDLELKSDPENLDTTPFGVTELRAMGPSRASRESLKPALQSDWKLSYQQTDTGDSFSYNQPTLFWEVERNFAEGTLTVRTGKAE